jgi:hypothetical protein
MSDQEDFTAQLLAALRRFVEGDAEPLKRLWSRRVDVTIVGGCRPTSSAGPRSGLAWTGPPRGYPKAGLTGRTC